MKIVVVGIIADGQRILLCQRKRTSRYGMKWEFPGGKLEEGETPESCLRRELSEELGISAVIGTLYHSQQTVYPDNGAFDVLYYRVLSFSGMMVNKVFESFRWVPVTELFQFDILEGNREVLQRLVHEQAHSPG